MIIPHKELDPLTLNAIIEEYISREGTDYGFQEYSLSEKVQQVLNQLEQGEIVLNFDPESESCNLLANELK